MNGRVFVLGVSMNGICARGIDVNGRVFVLGVSM